jgi:hypothetical protein
MLVPLSRVLIGQGSMLVPLSRILIGQGPMLAPLSRILVRQGSTLPPLSRVILAGSHVVLLSSRGARAMHGTPATLVEIRLGVAVRSLIWKVLHSDDAAVAPAPPLAFTRVDLRMRQIRTS